MLRNSRRAFQHSCQLLLLVTVAGCQPATTSLESRFQSHVYYLASPKLEGRGVGTKGIELAAEYVASEFRKAGLEPGVDGDYFQTFSMITSRELGACRVAFGHDSLIAEFDSDFMPFAFTSGDAFSGDLVFCGYGIVAEERDWNDFADVDISGKVALMLRGQPDAWDNDEQTKPWHKTFRNKIYNAKDRGATAILIVNQAEEDDELIKFSKRTADAYGIPAMHLTRKFANRILEHAGMSSLSVLQQQLDGGSNASAPIPQIHVEGEVQLVTQNSPTRNVVGILRGKGVNQYEYVVIGAHYDHLGRRVPMRRSFRGGQLLTGDREPEIHFGADDNASGTAGLIEAARMLSEDGGCNRSVVFIAFSGEESGLHGSKHYVENPVFPLDKTVAMLNLDMIGRLDDSTNRLNIFGTGSAAEFDDLIERSNEALGLDIASSADPGGRSDHAPFVRKRIPGMHFYSGSHGDYHKPSDTPDKINAAGGARITRLVADVTREIGNSQGSLTFQEFKVKKPASDPDDAPSYRVVMGLHPGYADDGKKGMLVEAVNHDGPAHLGGMKGGDRIISIGGKPVANIYDYMASTRGNKPGDVVEVIVLRGGAEVRLKVTLAGAG